MLTNKDLPEKMPPTRGHDLKLRQILRGRRECQDAPHTGARLETRIYNNNFGENMGCPPHGGTT